MRSYPYYVSPFSFRIKRLPKSAGWKAEVKGVDGWRSVIFPHGQCVHTPTKREMVAYLNYAYAGIESKVHA